MEKKIFLAAPFKALVNNKSNAMQDSDRKRIEDLISFFEGKGYLVHNAHKREAWGKNFMEPEECTYIDYHEIEKCDLFVAFPGIPASPGTHIEIGWASAFHKKIVLILFENQENYAYLVRGLSSVSDVKYIIYNSDHEYLSELAKYLEELEGGV